MRAIYDEVVAAVAVQYLARDLCLVESVAGGVGALHGEEERVIVGHRATPAEKRGPGLRLERG